eukprot:765179-Hanusia_phi.AAC.1
MLNTPLIPSLTSSVPARPVGVAVEYIHQEALQPGLAARRPQVQDVGAEVSLSSHFEAGRLVDGLDADSEGDRTNRVYAAVG